MSRRIPIAVAALLRDHQVLMVHRRPDRQWYPDCWDLPGGHVEAGESPEQAVVRECHEELGIRVVPVRSFSLPIADSTIEMHAFVVDQWNDEPVNAAPDEHDDLRWVGATELTGLTLADPAALPALLGLLV